MEGHGAIATGAGRGNGLATAQRRVRDGWRVCLPARNAEPLATAVTELGGQAYALGVAGKADDPAHQAETVGAAIEAYGRLDLLVNNAGINPVFGPLLEVDPAAVRKVFDVNVFGVLGWVRTAYDASLRAHGGAVGHGASIAGLGPARGLGAVAGSKAALVPPTRQPSL